MFMSLRLIFASAALCLLGRAECRLIGGSTFTNQTSNSTGSGAATNWKVKGDYRSANGACFADAVRVVSVGQTAYSQWQMTNVKYAYVYDNDLALFANQWKNSSWWLKISPSNKVKVVSERRQTGDRSFINRYRFTDGQKWELR